MGDKEPEKENANPDSMPGLMTRGRLQKLQGITNPKPTNRRYMDEEFLTSDIKTSVSKSEQSQYRKMVGRWVPQQMWPPDQLMRMGNMPKMMPKHPNFFVPPAPQQLAHQMTQQMAQMPPHMAHMPIRPNQMQPQRTMQAMSPKMAQMMTMMMPGLRGVPFSPKSQPHSPNMAKNMRTVTMVPGMANVNPMMYPQMFHRISTKSPPYVRHAVFRGKVAKTSVSPKNMETFLNENPSRDDKIDLNQLLREEIKKILSQELDRLNDLHTDSANYDKQLDTNFLSKSELNDSTDNKYENDDEQEKKDKPFKCVDPDGIVDVLIEGFKEVLEVLWNETKKYHQYSLDECYYKYSSQFKLEDKDSSLNKVKKRGKKKTKPELVVVRDFNSLRTLFKKRDEIEKLMASYRNTSRASLGNSYFTFSNFNTGAAQNESETGKEGADEDVFLKKAIEYADVASNQRHLLNNVTALDFRAALSGDYLINYLPKAYRSSLMETVSTIHFDLGTPPQLSPKLSKHPPEQDAVLNKVYDTLQSFQNSEAPAKQTAAMLSYPHFMTNFGTFRPDERMREMMVNSASSKRGLGLPAGMGVYSSLPASSLTVPPNLPPNVAPNMPQGMISLPMNAGKGVPLPPGVKNFNLPPGLIPPQMVMPNLMTPHMSTNQFFNK